MNHQFTAGYTIRRVQTRFEDSWGVFKLTWAPNGEQVATLLLDGFRNEAEAEKAFRKVFCEESNGKAPIQP